MPNPSLILMGKLLVLGTWLVGAMGFLWPETTTFGSLGRMLFGVLAVVHAVECGVFYRTLTKTGRPIGLELAQTFFFGIVHYSEAKLLADANAGGEEPSA
jgi:uncharacterized protein YhhL (DUF1145 family)